jgi:DNA-binding CsgD family transcriptional regulator
MKQITFTDRENEVAALVAQGLSNKEIGKRLGISTNTVRNFLARIMTKTRVANRAELAGLIGREGKLVIVE